MLAVEPDFRMAAVASSHGIPVEVATFEGWDPAHRVFDIVVSGQAWHWVGRHDAPTKAALDEAYVRFAPALAKESVPLGNEPSDRSDDIAAIAATHLFAPCQLRTYGWTQQYSRDEWLDQLCTHSDHIALEPQQRAALLDAVGTAIDRLGSSLTLHYETELISAQRMA